MAEVTYREIAERTETSVPLHLETEASPPVKRQLAEIYGDDDAPVGRQGDVYVTPLGGTFTDHRSNPSEQVSFPSGPVEGERIDLVGRGHQVVRGDADRNAHILQGNGCVFVPCAPVDVTLDYGVLLVPEGAVAYLTHTDEHGSIGFAEGQWRVHGQASFEGELIARAAD